MWSLGVLYAVLALMSYSSYSHLTHQLATMENVRCKVIFDFRVVVYNIDECKEYGYSRAKARVYDLADCLLGQLRKQLSERKDKWFMVDYHIKTNLLFTSDEAYDEAILEKYYVTSGEDHVKNIVEWPRKVSEIIPLDQYLSDGDCETATSLNR